MTAFPVGVPRDPVPNNDTTCKGSSMAYIIIVSRKACSVAWVRGLAFMWSNEGDRKRRCWLN